MTSVESFASVVIPGRNEAGNLEFLLDEVAASLAGRPFAIPVVDDGSTDDTAAIAAADPA